MKEELVESKYTHQQCSYFAYNLLVSIKARLRVLNWNKLNVAPLTIFISDSEIQYCNTAIKAVERAFKPLGWNCKLLSFVDLEYKPDRYCYTFNFNRMDDLPF